MGSSSRAPHKSPRAASIIESPSLTAAASEERHNGRLSPSRSSFTSRDALSPSSRRFLSICLERCTATLSSELMEQPMMATGRERWSRKEGEMPRLARAVTRARAPPAPAPRKNLATSWKKFARVGVATEAELGLQSQPRVVSRRLTRVGLVTREKLQNLLQPQDVAVQTKPSSTRFTGFIEPPADVMSKRKGERGGGARSRR